MSCSYFKQGSNGAVTVQTAQQEGDTVHDSNTGTIDLPDCLAGPHQVLRVRRRPHCRQVADRADKDDSARRDSEALQGSQENSCQSTKRGIFY